MFMQDRSRDQYLESRQTAPCASRHHLRNLFLASASIRTVAQPYRAVRAYELQCNGRY
jgi:hypothetical protein